MMIFFKFFLFWFFCERETSEEEEKKRSEKKEIRIGSTLLSHSLTLVSDSGKRPAGVEAEASDTRDRQVTGDGRRVDRVDDVTERLARARRRLGERRGPVAELDWVGLEARGLQGLCLG
jgi:hypothetical protein